jgi:hypothetical protein
VIAKYQRKEIMKTLNGTYMRNAVKMRQAYKRLVKTIKPYWIVYKSDHSSRVVDIKEFFSQRA